MQQFSVLMSLYIKERSDYARACFESLLAQTIPATEWIIVEDGPLTEELYTLLDEYQRRYPQLIKRVPLSQNGGLGPALARGIQECSYELVARMDTDDIAEPTRFARQLARFQEHPELDICGTWITEFEGEPEHIVTWRRVPEQQSDIYDYQKKRDAFNHMSVMFRKSAVLAVGNYEDVPLMEDTMLWSRMLLNHAHCLNIPDYLVNVRIGQEMFARRGGWAYFKKYLYGRRKVLATGFISYLDFWETIAVQFVVAMMPAALRAVVFKKVLHGGASVHEIYDIAFGRVYYNATPAMGYAA